MAGQALRLSCSIVRDEASFSALQPEWDDLCARAAVRSPFLRHSWARLCWERQRTSGSAQLFIGVVRDHDRAVLIAPFLSRPYRLFFHTLYFLDSQTPLYTDVLVEDGAHASAYVGYFLQSLRRMWRVRRLRISWLREDSPLVPHLDLLRQRRGRTESAPFIDLGKFGTWDAYFGSLPRQLRSDHRRQVQRLTHRGVALRDASDATCIADVAWLFAAKRGWIEQHQTTTWLMAPGIERLFAQFAAEGLASGRTWLSVLEADHEPIAAQLCFREGHTLYVSKMAYDPAWHSFSPSRTLMLLMLERAFKEGLKTCDLMIGAGAWKSRLLATGSIAVGDRKVKLHGF